MEAYSSILVWEIPWTEEHDPVFGVAKESDTTKQLNNNNNVFRVCHVIMTRLVHNSLIRTETSILVAMIS